MSIESAADILLKHTAKLTSLDRQRVISQIGQGQIESELAKDIWAKCLIDFEKNGITVQMNVEA